MTKSAAASPLSAAPAISAMTDWLSRSAMSVELVNFAENEPDPLTLPRCRSDRVLEPTSGSPVVVAPSILKVMLVTACTAPLTTMRPLTAARVLVVVAADGDVRTSEAPRVRPRPGMSKLQVIWPVAGMVMSTEAGFTSVNSSETDTSGDHFSQEK